MQSYPQITPRQLAVIHCIAEFQTSRRYSPTLAEIAQSLNVSRTTVFEHIAELQRKGLLENSPNKARSLKLTCKAVRLIDEAQPPPESRHEREGIALLGRVAAGLPCEAVENTETITFESLFGAGGDTFALEVGGQSMKDAGISPGDYVICRHASTAEDGQMVVAIVDDNEATLKRFYRQEDCIRLEARNPAFEPIFTNNCRICGVVVGHIRRI